MRRVLSRLVALSVFATPALARGDEWSVVGSTTTFELELTTTATAHCSVRRVILDGTCTALGNVVTLTHGGTSLFLTFVGGTQTLDMLVGHSRTPFTIGTFESRVEGDPGAFAFPHVASRDLPTFGWDITMTHRLPSGELVTRRISREAYLRGEAATQATLFHGPNARELTLGGTGPRPDGKREFQIALSYVVYPTVRAEDADVPLTAVASLVPEPATLSLVAAGLLSLGALDHTRRRRA